MLPAAPANAPAFGLLFCELRWKLLLVEHPSSWGFGAFFLTTVAVDAAAVAFFFAAFLEEVELVTVVDFFLTFAATDFFAMAFGNLVFRGAESSFPQPRD